MDEENFDSYVVKIFGKVNSVEVPFLVVYSIEIIVSNPLDDFLDLSNVKVLVKLDQII